MFILNLTVLWLKITNNNQPERFVMFLAVKSSGALFLISGVIREMSGVSELFPLSDLDQNRVFTLW